ncbi:iron-sulfur protein [Desulfuromonas versatilis]|uniref:Iron-sulfur protein n=1 Tax=Desulfuromonas versatilis TaxID=2802975 RepID=A0ABN6DSN9_9BACT|nr:4Fe-4S dicluster domain-containing protein [Desulfuromonas versatilis]BCR03160.1 iron-sulfur protein [Desulfuromonas versatilis]
MGKQRENQIIYADPETCLGCHSCELSCAVAHGAGDLQGAVAGGQLLRPRNKVVLTGGICMPMQCRQCEDAPCAFACPTGAVVQEDGQVRIREKNCVGCKLCVMVCPFGAVSVAAEDKPDGRFRTNRGVAKKCDLCADWRARSGRTSPACVEACPTRSLRLVDMEAYRRALREARAAELALSHKHLSLRKVNP